MKPQGRGAKAILPARRHMSGDRQHERKASPKGLAFRLDTSFPSNLIHFCSRYTSLRLSKEHFQYPGSKKLLDLIEDAGHKGMASRGSAFSDFLEIVICTLSGQQMEEAY